MSAALSVVIPCYNEGRRLSDLALLELLTLQPDLSLVLVDDGSTDDTGERLRAFATPRAERVHVLSLPENRGKAEAVRQGLLLSCARGAAFVAYLDADMATPPRELVRLYRLARDAEHDAVLGSRVALLGRQIGRSYLRHVLGRVFATAASLALRTPLYDTQCGAKVFRRTPALETALREPFASRWAFDVELLGRLLISGEGERRLRMVEEPLQTWVDVAGSKLRATHMARAAAELALIAQRQARARAGARDGR